MAGYNVSRKVSSVESLKKILLAKCQDAVVSGQNYAYEVIDKTLQQFYSEFTPSVYLRTYQLMSSLVKSEVRFTGNGYEAEVYFDVGLLDYSYKTLIGIGSWANKNWSEQKTLDAAMGGSHGGYIDGTAIWGTSIAILYDSLINVMIDVIKSAGIPVR